ncbi:stage III sporulation protein AF [Geomicrobium halophilum]|uniref:Stage III sporulation protein AF n=1 Tax=Geomicrobium halophilum TaxID=549000 RepID=A0A841PX09_9BACL|nr:stage III sporulation protein AF [Geomicrobium halophilum]
MIVFLLIAVILELLLPTATMKRYADLVLGLIMMILILQPVFDLLNRDPSTWFEWDEIQVTEGVDKMESEIDEKKSEIQASQDAYISEQVAARLSSEAEPVLEEDFDLFLQDIAVSDTPGLEIFVEAGEEPEEQEHEEEEPSSVPPVEEVSTNTTEAPDSTRPNQDSSNTEEVRERLAEIWEVDESIIDVSLEEEGAE